MKTQCYDPEALPDPREGFVQCDSCLEWFPEDDGSCYDREELMSAPVLCDDCFGEWVNA